MAQAEIRLVADDRLIAGLRELTAAIKVFKENFMAVSLDELALKAYAAYAETTGHKNYQGLPMPAFADLGDNIQAAWRAAAQAVAQSVVLDDEPIDESDSDL